MITLEVFRIALESIRAHKLRSFLNLLGIIIAVATIVAVISIVSGLNEYAANLINQMGPNTFIITKFGIITSRTQFLEAMKRKDITLEDAEAVRRLVPEAAHPIGPVHPTHELTLLDLIDRLIGVGEVLVGVDVAQYIALKENPRNCFLGGFKAGVVQMDSLPR